MIQSLFSQEGRYLGIGIPREQKIQIDTLPSERRERKDLGTGKTHSYEIIHRHTNPIVKAADWHNPYGKRESSTDTARPSTAGLARPILYGGQARPSQRGKQRTPPGGQARPTAGHANHTAGGKAQSVGQAETPSRRAETLTLEGANQGIKESGHRSRRPPAHKGYNQFIKDARRSQRAAQLSQLKPMEGKI